MLWPQLSRFTTGCGRTMAKSLSPTDSATGSHFFSKKYPQGKSGIVTSDPNTLLPTSPAQVAPTVPIYCVRTLALQQVPAAGILFCNCFLPAATGAQPPIAPSSYSASHEYFQKSLVPYFQPLTPCVSPAHHRIRPSLALYFSRNEETAPAHPSSTGPPAPLTVFPLY